MKDSVLKLKEVIFAYRGKGKPEWILNQASYSFCSETMYTIYGGPGSGKTTLLLLLSALEDPSVGLILYRDIEIRRIGESEYRRYYTSFIRQKDNLLSYYDALQNVLEAAKLAKKKESCSKEDALKILERTGIDRDSAVKKAGELTAGEQQRVAVARALASGAEVILVDEPEGCLEKAEAKEFFSLLKQIAKQEHKCVIVTTGDKELAAQGEVALQLNDQILLEKGEEETMEQRTTRARLAKRYEKEEEKKNSGLLYKILLKNFKSNWKNFVQFFSSTVLSVALVFSALSIQYMLKGFYKREGGDAFRQGLSGMIFSSLAVISVLTMFLMLFSLQNYVRSRIKDYAVFRIIGIQSKTINLMMAVEYIGSLLASIVAGFVFGNAAVLIFRQVIVKNYPGHVKIPYPSLGTYGITVLVSVGIFFVTFIINQEYYVEAELAKTAQTAVQQEKRPKKALWFQMLMGIVLVLWSLCMYADRGTGELWYFPAVFLIGFYLLAKSAGIKSLIRLRDRKIYYYRNLLSLNQFYYRYQSNARSMLFLFVLQFLLLFYLPVQVFPMFPMNIEEQYPYDYMMYCSKEHTEYLDGLSEKYQVTYKETPAVRINVAKGSSNPLNYTKTWNQGENIGMSESGYMALTGENSETKELKEKEIKVIFQEDKAQAAHPLDWNNLQNEPEIRLGPARPYDPYSEKNIFSSGYKLVNQMRQIDVGVFGNGMHENIVVFSDEYFSEIEEGNVLALINVPEENAALVKADLQKFEEENLPVHDFNWQIKKLYSKTDAIDSRKAENFLKLALNIFFFAAFFFSNFFIAYQKLCADIPYLQRKYEMLNCVGMRVNNQKKLLSKEIYTFCLIPSAAALLFSMIFTGVVLKMRFYTSAEWGMYLKLAVPYTIVICGIQIIGMFCMRRYLIHQVIR